MGEYIRRLEQALISLLDGLSVNDIIVFTGMPYEKAEAIMELYRKLVGENNGSDTENGNN